MKRRALAISIGAACLTLWMGLGLSLAQSRKQISINAPSQNLGSLRGGTSTFNQNSFGLGSLRGSPLAPGSNVLRSSVNQTPNMSISRRSISGGSGGLGAIPELAGGSKQVYKSPGIAITTDAMRRMATGGGADVLVAASYLEAVGTFDQSGIAKQVEPIKSFVPDQPGLYRDHMEKGELAFRAGKFASAYNEFQLANYIAREDPASLLSMAHARFADGYYGQAVLYVREALTYFPELPLVPLQPSGFYGDAALYVDHQYRLRDHQRKYVNDAGACLLEAYFKWFSQDSQGATKALLRSRELETLALAEEPSAERRRRILNRLETIDIFQTAMVASGRIRTDQPEATSRPSSSSDGDAASRPKPTPPTPS